MSKLYDEALAEVEAAITAMAAQHEGLRDYMLLDLKDETRAEVAKTLEAYNIRYSWLTFLRDRIVEMKQNVPVYPELPAHEVAKLVHDDLQENLQTITAAIAIFTAPEKATQMNVTSGAPQPK